MAPKLLVEDPVGAVARPAASPVDFGAGVGIGMQRLGQSVSNASTNINAAMDQRARYRATQYRVAYQAEAQKLLDDPDLERRDERLDRVRRDLSKQYRSGNHGTFDREASVIDAQVGANFQYRTRLQAIEQGQSDLSDNLRVMANEWAEAEGDADAQQEIALRAETAVDGARETGLIDDQLAGESLRRFQGQSARGVFARMLREDPERAVAMMSEPHEGFDETERQELLTRAVRAHAGVMRAERMAEEERRKAEAELEKDRARDIERELIEREAAGDLTLADVVSVVEFLPPATGRLWVDRVRSGSGGSGGGSSNVDRGLHVQLEARVKAGDPTVIDDITAAYEANQITKTIYDELTDGDQLARFGEARRFLTDSLDMSSVILEGPSAQQLLAREAQAYREFDTWKNANPDATREESMRMADYLARTAQLVDVGGIGAFNLQPTLLVGDAKTPESVQATRKAIAAAYRAGNLNETEAAFEARLLENLERIHRRRATVTGQ